METNQSLKGHQKRPRGDVSFSAAFSDSTPGRPRNDPQTLPLGLREPLQKVHVYWAGSNPNKAYCTCMSGSFLFLLIVVEVSSVLRVFVPKLMSIIHVHEGTRSCASGLLTSFEKKSAAPSFSSARVAFADEEEPVTVWKRVTESAVCTPGFHVRHWKLKSGRSPQPIGLWPWTEFVFRSLLQC